LTPFIKIEGLQHSYDGRRILDVDRLEIREGEMLAVVGPNGSGKSTLLRIINLLEKPTNGEITFWDGSRLSEMDRGEKKKLALQMAMIFQEPLLFKRSVRANIGYGLKVRGTDRDEVEKRVEVMLERLDLAELADRDAMTLSGGEAQKVTLGRAMVLEPRLLLMDEPLASLDTPTRKVLRKDIARLVREMGVTAVYVSHDYQEVLEIADRLALIFDGRVLQEGRPSEVFSHPNSEVVAQFLGAENLLDGEVLDCREGLARVLVRGVELQAPCELPPGSAAKVLIHAEDITIVTDSARRSSARNSLPARITNVSVMGALDKIELDCGFRLVAYVTLASARELGLEAGMEVTAVIKAASIHIM